MNAGVAFVIMYWLIAPILYSTNVWDSAYFPIFLPVAFDNTGKPYQVTKITTDGIFDPVKYASYSRPYLPLSLLISYGVSFALLWPSLYTYSVRSSLVITPFTSERVFSMVRQGYSSALP